MDEKDPRLVRCPCCGSLLTSPREGSFMWMCRYHLCHAVFPVGPFPDPAQVTFVAEEEPPYHQGEREHGCREGMTIPCEKRAKCQLTILPGK